MEKAVKLDPKNRDYLLELYTLRSKLGDVSPEFQKEARMYYYLGEGERLLKEAKNQDALSFFLQARQANLNSPVPLVKIGDLFMAMNDVANARMNFKQAAELAPTAIEVWSRYIDALIRSYDWEEASRAMERFRKLPVQQSAIDKLAGDIYAKQGAHGEAQILYRKAMAREVIDSSVYIAYANSLSASRLCKDAPFFYALALRFDPFNTEAIIGTAKCLASSESIDRGIVLLQDSLQKFSQPRADLLTAIADLQIQKGEWKAADQFVDQAMRVDVSFAPPWKTKAQIYLQKQDKDPQALTKAIDAYGSYIERNPSDPTGYLERHQLLIQKRDYSGADEDLNRLSILYPKYPGVNVLKGQLYLKVGRPVEAKAAFLAELKATPNSVITLLELGRLAGAEGTPETMSEALKYFNQAVALAPSNAEAKAEAGWINYQMKNSPGAAAMLESAISIDPGNPSFYRRLGYVYRSLGQTDQARKAFRKYLDMDPDAPDRPELERF
jgi:tetratricopeptide (TPR) repeat protein